MSSDQESNYCSEQGAPKAATGNLAGSVCGVIVRRQFEVDQDSPSNGAKH
jgi:hypothetical protein